MQLLRLSDWDFAKPQEDTAPDYLQIKTSKICVQFVVTQ